MSKIRRSCPARGRVVSFWLVRQAGILALVFAVLALPASAGQTSGGMTISAPYARIMGKIAKSGGVFVEIRNTSGRDDRLVAVETPIAKSASLHTTIFDDGVMKMRRIKGGVPIAAGQTHLFARGGDHIMLMGLTRHPTAGERFALTLVFQNAGRVEIMVPVDNKR